MKFRHEYSSKGKMFSNCSKSTFFFWLLSIFSVCYSNSLIQNKDELNRFGSISFTSPSMTGRLTTTTTTTTHQQQHHHQRYNSDGGGGGGGHHHRFITDQSTKSSADSPMGCKELRSKRYISDGPCTSIKPVTEVVCAGVCLPVSKLPWYSDYASLWSRPDEDEWQCIDDVVKRKRIHLQCQDGQRRSYVIRTVRSCKCKKRKRTLPTNKTPQVTTEAKRSKNNK